MRAVTGTIQLVHKQSNRSSGKYQASVIGEIMITQENVSMLLYANDQVTRIISDFEDSLQMATQNLFNTGRKYEI